MISIAETEVSSITQAILQVGKKYYLWHDHLLGSQLQQDGFQGAVLLAVNKLAGAQSPVGDIAVSHTKSAAVVGPG